jgi:hypothetical protein
MLRSITFLLAALLLSSCTNSSITNLQTATIAAHGDSPIYVTRFEGKPDFFEEATDQLVAQLQSKTQRRIIQGDVIRNEGPDILRGGNIASRQPGIAAAKAAGASLLVVGNVSSHHTGEMLNGFVTVRVIDVSTGSIVGTVHRPSGMLIAHSEHQCVLAAAKRAADALSKTL